MRLSPFRLFAFVPAAVLAFAACAQPQAPGSAAAVGQTAAAKAPDRSRRCFLTSQIDNWRASGDRTVYVRASLHRVFRLQLMGACPNVDWTQRLGIEATPGPQICSGIDATILSPSPIGVQRCPVSAIQELTPEEIAALPKRDRP